MVVKIICLNDAEVGIGNDSEIQGICHDTIGEPQRTSNGGCAETASLDPSIIKAVTAVPREMRHTLLAGLAGIPSLTVRVVVRRDI